MLLRNLHCHTWRCKHATGDIEDLCEEAIKGGLKVLGISEHAPQPDNRWNATHMDLAELEGYCSTFTKMKEKYQGKLKLYLGLECEYRPDYLSFFTDELLDRLQFDYLAAGPHWYPDPMQVDWPCAFYDIYNSRDMHLYTDYVIRGMASGLFQFYTHPDVFAFSYYKWDKNTQSCCRKIIEASCTYHVALEINGLGLRREKINTPQGIRPPYPFTPFWEIAAEYPDVEVICNSDAHVPQDVAKGIDLASNLAQQLNLKETNLFYNI